MERTIQITKRYIWLPIHNKVSDTTIELYVEDEKIQEIYIGISAEKSDFYAWIDAKKYLGKTISFVGEYTENWFKKLMIEDTIPTNDTVRPHIHYAPTVGWMNDPNGLLCHKGVYHIYHQHNPYGVKWENIHWAHTETKDFIHWKTTTDVLFPDKEGPIFSGTGIIDEKNCLGYGTDALLFFYTSAGGRSKWSKDYRFTQKIAYSLDGGRTLEKSDKFCMEHLAAENRDPKVFYHAATMAYILILYIDEDMFYFFRSSDLLHWEKTQEIQVKGMWECPDFFEVICEDDKSTAWVLWSADGYYCLGDFDGYKFEKKSDRLEAYSMKHSIEEEERKQTRAYAAQTFNHVTDRVLQQSWIVSQKEGKPYAGLLSLPVEISLCNTKEGKELSLNPARELLQLREREYIFKLDELCKCEKQCLLNIADKALEISININRIQKGNLNITLLDNCVRVDFDKRKVQVMDREIRLPKETKFDLRIFADVDVLELFGMNGTRYMVVDNVSSSLNGKVELEADTDMSGSIAIYELSKIIYEL